MNRILRSLQRPMQAFRRFRVVLVAAVALLAACAVKPVSGPSAARRAARLDAEQHYESAARAWLAAAAATSATSAVALARLNAARDFERVGRTADAWEAIAPIAVAALPATQQLEGAEIKARIALDARRPQVALAALAAAPATTGATARLRLLELEGRARFASGEPAAGLKTLVARGQLAASPSEVLANDELIWSLLLGEPALPSAEGLSVTGQGWIALAHIWRTAWEVPGEFTARLADWKVAYPQHPAAEGLLAEIEAQEKAQLTYPPRVAVLLPLSGPYAGQARAVQAGLLDAYYRSAEPRPTIAVYDTSGTALGARAALTTALSAGADFVIGPLTAFGAEGAAAARPAVPILALNYLGAETAPPRFFQFGLSPAQEAKASAEHAVSQGLVRAAILVPDNSWGRSIAQAFEQRLSDLGGETLASASFPDGSEDFGAPLARIFGLDASELREQKLAGLLGQPLGFAPRRRQDVQFVFFAAPYQTARLIVPQIDYYQGYGLPVFSISDVFRPDTVVADLNGVWFPVMPWFTADSGPVASVRRAIHSLFPDGWKQLAPLYALGYDAWRLVPILANSAHPLARPVRGMTGLLSLGPGNVIQRSPDWARYVGGHLQAVAAAPST